MMRVNLKGFVVTHFADLFEFKKCENTNEGQNIKFFSDFCNLTSEAKRELLGHLVPLYSLLWDSHLKALSSTESVTDKKRLEEIATRLNKIEMFLSPEGGRSQESLLTPPLSFMELAKQFAAQSKTNWRQYFMMYYYTGVYEKIIKNNPIFQLHFSDEERLASEGNIDDSAVDGLYLYAQKLNNFNLNDVAMNEENSIDKAVIFLRTEYYRYQRLDGPEFKTWGGYFFGHSRTTKCGTLEQIQNLILDDNKIEEFAELLEKSDIGLNGLSSQFIGEVGVALAPLFIHLAVSNKFPSDILVKLGIQRGSSVLSYVGL